MQRAAPQETTMIQTLDSAAQANLTTGVLLLCKEALVTAIQDRRLERGHLRVLATMVGYMNSRSAKAWPSRAAIAETLGMALKTVSNILLELRAFGYLIADRQAVEEANNRRLTVYTFGNIDHETIRREITAFVKSVRAARTTQEVPVHGELQSPRPRGTSPPTGNSEAEKFPAHGARSSPPTGPRNSMKELHPIGGEKSPQPAPTLKQVIWQHGINWLVSSYNGSMTEKDIRSRLGALIKNHGQGLVLDAMGKAESAHPLDALDYMTVILEDRKKGAAAHANPASRAEAKRRLDAI